MSHGFNEARVKVAHPYLTMMGLYLGGFTGMFSETCLNIALPQLGVAFGVDTAITQWLVIGYMLVIGLVMPFASILMKWFSVRKLTLFSLGAFIAGSLVSGCAPTFEVLLFGRLVQGIGTGLILPMMFSMVLEVFPPCKIGAAMGVTALIIMFAPAIGPTLSGILLGVFSWRAIFFSFVVVLAVGVAFASKFLVNPYELTRPSVDALSCVLSCIGFGGLVLGVGLASSYGWASAQVLAPLACGIVALAWYARRQLMIDVPIINVRIFGIRGFVLGGAAMMINFGITLSAMFLLPQFIQNAMGVAVAMTGIIMLPGGIVNAIVSMLAGRLYDRVGACIPARIGFALSIAGSIMLLLAMGSSTIVYVIVAHIVLMNRRAARYVSVPDECLKFVAPAAFRRWLHCVEYDAAGAWCNRDRSCDEPFGLGPGELLRCWRHICGRGLHGRIALGLRVHVCFGCVWFARGAHAEATCGKDRRCSRDGAARNESVRACAACR